MGSPQKSAQKFLPKTWLDDCPFLGKVPLMNPNDAEVEMSERLMRTRTACKVMWMLWKNPKEAMATATFLEDRVEGQGHVGVETDEWFAEAPCTMMKVKPEFLLSYIRTLDDTWTEGALGRARAYESQQLVDIVCGYLNMGKFLKLPSACQNKLVLKKALDKRKAEIQPRFQVAGGLPPTFTLVDTEGRVNWKALPIYTVTFDAKGKATEITHEPTKAKAAITSDIDKEWWMENAWSDTKATLAKTKTDRHKCCDYFDKGEGPHADSTMVGSDKHFEKIVRDAVAALDKKRNEVTADKLQKPGQAAEAPMTDRKAEHVKKAREALAKRVAERSEQKRQKLS